MNDDYLWDKTGEPDAEIKRLEEVLGALRYQPRPLALSPNARVTRRFRIFPSLAIAAGIALMLLAAGLWLTLNRQRTAPSIQTRQPEQTTNDRQVPAPPQQTENREKQAQAVRLPHRTQRNLMAKTNSIRRHEKSPIPGLSPAERNEALLAKDQLMLALRVASSKLNLAQRRTLAPTPNNIRNQHKVG